MITKFKLFESLSNFNNLIDYTYLKDNVTIDLVKDLCEEAIENKFYSICVLPKYVSTTKSFTDDEVYLTTIVGLPDGKSKQMSKDVSGAITDGADEIDIVLDFEKIKSLSDESGETYQEVYDELVNDLRAHTSLAHKEGVIIKAIIEIDELTFEQIKTACEICVDASADYIMTSSGYSKQQKSFEDKLGKIKYMRKILPDHMQIKAAGGIRSKQQVEELLPYVDRIGTSVLLQSDEKIKKEETVAVVENFEFVKKDDN